MHACLLVACLVSVHSAWHLVSVYQHHIAGLTCRHVLPQGGYGGYDQGYGSYGTGSGSQSNVPAAVANAAQSLPAESQQKLANIVAKVRAPIVLSIGAHHCRRQSVSIAAFGLYGGEGQSPCSRKIHTGFVPVRCHSLLHSLHLQIALEKHGSTSASTCSVCTLLCALKKCQDLYTPCKQN